MKEDVCINNDCSLQQYRLDVQDNVVLRRDLELRFVLHELIHIIFPEYQLTRNTQIYTKRKTMNVISKQRYITLVGVR